MPRAEQDDGAGRLDVLCADDDPDIRMLTEMSLSLDPAFHASCVDDGPSVLRRLDEGLRPAVILLDSLLPAMSGAEVARAIRARGDMDDVPIIFLTAQADPRRHDRLYDSGASAIITKPFNPLILAQQIRKIIEDASE